jgi:Chalcone isomerase-like
MRHATVLLFLGSSLLLLLVTSVSGAMTDKATGIPFGPKIKEELALFGVGVRKKGPIKVYAVGLYSNETLKEELALVSKAADQDKTQALSVLRNGVKEHPTTFLLEMNFKVGAEKMANAIAESVTPRYTNGNPKDVEDLKQLILQGVAANKGSSVGKGNQIQFDCSPEGIAVAVDGKRQGNVTSSGLAAAFCDVYLDDKSVSPTLRESCIAECCSP